MLPNWPQLLQTPTDSNTTAGRVKSIGRTGTQPLPACWLLLPGLPASPAAGPAHPTLAQTCAGCAGHSACTQRPDSSSPPRRGTPGAAAATARGKMGKRLWGQDMSHPHKAGASLQAVGRPCPCCVASSAAPVLLVDLHVLPPASVAPRVAAPWQSPHPQACPCPHPCACPTCMCRMLSISSWSIYLEW